MAAGRAWASLLVLVPALLAGCTSGEEPVDPGAGAAPDGGRDVEGPTLPPRAPPGEPTSTTSVTFPTEAPAPPPPPSPKVVVAHVDTGINPYHRVFRDDSPAAWVHPAKRLPGYPANATALLLTLDAPTWEDAFAADAAVWSNVTRGTLYWIPGTKIVGAISLGPGGTRGCTLAEELTSCAVVDTPVLDDHGHGTMTATRSAGREGSLAPEALFVSVEGLGGDGVRWIAEQGWIDVQTNSWGEYLPSPASRALGDSTADVAFAAARMPTVFASGNGLAFQGVAPTPTYLQPTLPAGAFVVGAHDNGRSTLWHGSPPHVVADGYGGIMAEWRSLDAIGPSGEACCTSASAPYAAGGVAAVLLEARRMLGDTATGPRDGALAVGAADVWPAPLDDGKLTLDELRALVLRTADPRPTEGPHDGLLHWGAGGGATPNATQPGGNPYCPGCWTTPLAWRDVPESAPAYPLLGYGGISPSSVARAAAVLHGSQPMPERAAEDALFGLDQQARGVLPGGG